MRSQQSNNHPHSSHGPVNQPGSVRVAGHPMQGRPSHPMQGGPSHPMQGRSSHPMQGGSNHFPAGPSHSVPVSSSHTVINRSLPASPYRSIPRQPVPVHPPVMRRYPSNPHHSHHAVSHTVHVHPHSTYHRRNPFSLMDLAIGLTSFASLMSVTDNNILGLYGLVNAYPANRLALYNLTYPRFNTYVGTSALNLLNYVATFPEYSEQIYQGITSPINRLREYVNNDIENLNYLLLAFPLHRQAIYDSLFMPYDSIPTMIAGDLSRLDRLKQILPEQAVSLSQYDALFTPAVMFRM